MSSSPQRWLILAIVSSALFLIVVDVTVLYLALPHLTQDLHATASQKLWIVNAYALAVAALLPTTGALADRHGYKSLFIGGMVIFGLSSLLAAFSPTPTMLIVARVCLAVGAAMMMPSTLAIIRLVFEDPQERAVAIGTWAAIASGGAALGPVVGGVLLEYFWWGSVFLMNVPIILLALPPALRWIPRNAPNTQRTFDPVASVLMMLALFGLTLSIKTLSAGIQELALALSSLAVAVLSAWMLVVRQRRTGILLIDFKLFHHPLFKAGSIAALTASAVLLGMELAISQRLQLVTGMSALQAALTLLPIALAAFVVGPISGYYLNRVGVHRMLWMSLLVSGLGFAGYRMTMHAALEIQAITFVVMGIGLGGAITAASSAMLLNAPAKQAGMAASIEEVSYELGAALGVAILGSLLVAIYSANLSIPDAVTLSDAQKGSAQHHIDAAIEAAKGLSATQAQMLLNEVHLAFDRAFAWGTSVAAGALLLVAWFIRQGYRPSRAEQGQTSGSEA